jgi:hypothetical protein
MVLCLVITAFEAGRWTGSSQIAKADTSSPQIDVRQVDGSTSLVVYYPDLKKTFFYQPFAGGPTSSCVYSIQLSTPGGKIDRQPCSGPF